MFRLYTCDKATNCVLIIYLTPDYISLEEAAHLLKKSVQTVRRMVKRGDLPAQQVKTPQGFYYQIKRENLWSNSPIQVFSNSPIQNVDKSLYVEGKQVLTNQNQILTNQNTIVPIIDEENRPIDKKEPEIGQNLLRQLLSAEHQEKMVLIAIIEKLQKELYEEKRKLEAVLHYVRSFFE